MTSEEITTQCCECKVIKLPDGTWGEDPVEFEKDNKTISHGYCPTCYKIYMSESMEITRKMK